VTIRFESVAREARLLNPLKNFELESQAVEHRRDPLTGRSVIVLRGRMDYVRRFIESDGNFLDELHKSSQPDCPFCPGALLSKAPKFIPEIASEGRIQVGDAVCFPSLFAHEDFNALVVPTQSHRLGLNEFSSTMLVNAFKACLKYFQKVRAYQAEVKYAAIVMNFLPPAGSTIAHAHLQALASDLPFQSNRELLEMSEAYFQNNGTNYWADLVEAEKQLNARYLGKIGNVHWLTPFAPFGLNEAQAIVLGKSSLDALSDNDLNGLAEGMIRVLRFYDETGIMCFNAAIYSGPLGEAHDYFDVGVRLVSRYGYKPRFVSDAWSLQYLLRDQEVYESPEETCQKLRKHFAGL
jgi:galactose-1-phosphate uridylyltransferase